MVPETFRCYLVTKNDAGEFSGELVEQPIEKLPEGEALVRVAYSSLNFKDALSATGNPGVTRKFPHVPGLDVSGVVAESGVFELVQRDPVVIASFNLGVDRWGGFAEYVRVPLDWIVPLPRELTLRESMILGTAGFTAAMCVDTLRKHEVHPDSGDIVVTGASGGVGSVVVAILAQLGYHVTAVSGKESAREYLEQLGAERIIGRDEVDDSSGKPLLAGRWAGAVDAVGGNILATLLRTTRERGCVTACGVTAGAEMPLTVYPFILRGVSLCGIDSSRCPLPLRHELWGRLATQWKPKTLETMARPMTLEDLPKRIPEILAGKITGRSVIEIGGEDCAAP